MLVLAACGHREAPPPRESTTTLVVHVTADGKPAGARVLLFDQRGAPVHVGNLDLYGRRQGATACQLAPSVVASWDGLILGEGQAEVPIGADRCVPSPAIPYGRYKVWAWRGIEFERWEGEVDLSAGRGKVALEIPLERAWTPHGTLAADLHVHAHASNDSTLPNPQRVIAQVAAGVQVIGLSDHNVNGDLEDEIRALHWEDRVVSLPSNELTSEQLHVGVYPVIVDKTRPANGGPPVDDHLLKASPAEMIAIAQAMPGRPVIQINHPRFRVSAMFDGTGWDGVAWPPPFPLGFDAVEVLSGYTAFNDGKDRRFDDSVRDFYTLLDHGHVYAGLGNSDTHDLNWVLDGTTRNYVFVDDPRTLPFDQDGFVAAIRHHRVVATSGPWLDVEVAPKRGAPTVGPGQHVVPVDGAVWVDVTVSQARFVHVDRIRITIGGPKLAQQIDVPAGRSFHWAGSIAVAGDTWLGVTADGDTPLPVEQTGTYQKDKWNRAGDTPFAFAAPVLIDGDGDGHWKRGDAELLLDAVR